MTSEDFSMASSSSVNLRSAATDLARRFSSLRDFIPAANELLTCNNLPADDVKRHCRKIVTLIEIARATLTRSGIKLHQYASCMPALVRYKAAYFDMLHMLQQQRHLMQEDQPFQDRINRLLLPLSTNLRAAASEETARLPSSRGQFSSVAVASPPSMHVPTVAIQRHRPRKAGSSTAGQMLPPDVLLETTIKSWNVNVWENPSPAGSSQRRPQWMDVPQHDHDGDSDEDEDERPVILQQPRRRFGIFCTGQQGSRRPGGLRR